MSGPEYDEKADAELAALEESLARGEITEAEYDDAADDVEQARNEAAHKAEALSDLRELRDESPADDFERE